MPERSYDCQRPLYIIYIALHFFVHKLMEPESGSLAFGASSWAQGSLMTACYVLLTVLAVWTVSVNDTVSPVDSRSSLAWLCQCPTSTFETATLLPPYFKRLYLNFGVMHSVETYVEKDKINVPLRLSVFRDKKNLCQMKTPSLIALSVVSNNSEWPNWHFVTLLWERVKYVCFNIYSRDVTPKGGRVISDVYPCLIISGLSVWSHFSISPLMFFCLVLSLFLSYSFLLLAHSPKPPFSER